MKNRWLFDRFWWTWDALNRWKLDALIVLHHTPSDVIMETIFDHLILSCGVTSKRRKRSDFSSNFEPTENCIDFFSLCIIFLSSIFCVVITRALVNILGIFHQIGQSLKTSNGCLKYRLTLFCDLLRFFSIFSSIFFLRPNVVQRKVHINSKRKTQKMADISES